MAIRARCREWLVPLAGDGPVWGERGSQWPGKVSASAARLPSLLLKGKSQLGIAEK